MAQSSYPFDGLPTTETEYSLLFRELQDTGVAGSGTELSVSADASGLNVKVQPGMAIVRGHAYRSTAVETLSIAAGGTQPRIDVVMLELNPSTNTIALKVLQGTAAATPAAPALSQTESGLWREPLANVAVPANAVTIQAANVTDRRSRVGSRIREWTTALRPKSPRRATVGYNTTRGRWEWYSGSAWADLIAWDTLPGRPTTSTIDGRTLFVSDAAPTSSQGANGDLWFEY